MARRFNAAEWLESAWAPGAPQPMTFACWRRRDNTTAYSTLISAGNNATDLAFNALQSMGPGDGYNKGISFTDYAETAGLVGGMDTNLHFQLVEFDTNIIRHQMDNGTAQTRAWSPSGTLFNTLQISKTCSNAINEFFDGLIGHVMVWRAILTSGEKTALYNQTQNPRDIQSANLVAYLPFESDSLDVTGRTWTDHYSTTPAYESIAVTYPAAGLTGTVAASQDRQTEAAAGTVLLPASTGTVAQTQDRETQAITGTIVLPAGTGVVAAAQDRQTQAIVGNVVLPAQTGTVAGSQVRQTQRSTNISYSRTINHNNYDASTWSNSSITAAAALKVYFEHASTGQDIVGNSTTNSSVGQNQDLTADCGMHQLYDSNNRYLCDRMSYQGTNNATWFATHNGLQSNMRGNPGPANKLAMFLAMSAAMRAAVKVVMMKYCWIDVWDGSGYNSAIANPVTDGAAYAASMISQIEAFEAANPYLVHVWWTMPLQTNSDIAYPQRQIFNDAIRNYCSANNKYLIDIADIECYSPTNVKTVDANGREQAYTPYMMPDGGHLGTVGRPRLANAYWSMMATIAQDLSSNNLTGTVAAAQDRQTETVAGTVGLTVSTGTVAAAQDRQTQANVGTVTLPTGSGTVAAAQDRQTQAIVGSVYSVNTVGMVTAIQDRQTETVAGTTAIPVIYATVAQAQDRQIQRATNIPDRGYIAWSMTATAPTGIAGTVRG